MHNSFGNILKITTFGESHGVCMGVVIDGIPAGIRISKEDVELFLKERAQRNNPFTTPRKEKDQFEIVSGVYQDKTLGTPIAIIIQNQNIKSDDYKKLENVFRPSHGDFTWKYKYGHVDPRGGGRSSARETVTRVAAAAIANKILEPFDIKVFSFLSRIGDIPISTINYNEIQQNYFFSPDKDILSSWENLINNAINNHDSLGGLVTVHIKNVPAGLGDPVFNKLTATLAQAIYSIPAVKSLEFGEGLELSYKQGSDANDTLIKENDKIIPKTNHSGGVFGGISNGKDIILKISFKPTSSIGKTQQTVNHNGDVINLNIKGRHDPCVAIRGVVVAKAMCILAIADAILANKIIRN